MTQIHWVKDASDGFNYAVCWNTHTVPGAGDDAILDAPGATPYFVVSLSNFTVTGIETAATANLSVSAGTFTATNGTDGGVNAGTIVIRNGGTLAIDGTISNTGAISLNSISGPGPLFSVLSIGASGAAIVGGHVVLTDRAYNLVLGTFTSGPTPSVSRLIISSTLTGAGAVGADLQIVNGGIIDATGAAALTLTAGDSLLADSNLVTNNDLLEATNPNALAATGGLILSNVTIANRNGVIEASGAGTHVDLDGAVIKGGVLEALQGGVIQVNGTANVVDGVANAAVIAGAVEVSSGALLTLNGAIGNSGQIDVLSDTSGQTNGVKIGAAGVTLIGAGTIDLASRYGSLSGGALTNVDNTITGAGTISGMTLSNGAGALIEAIGGETLFVYHDTLNDVLGGEILAATASTVAVEGGVVAGGTLSTIGSGVILLTGAALDGTYSDVVNTGLLESLYVGLTIQGKIDNSGSIVTSGPVTLGPAGATLMGAGVLTLSGRLDGSDSKTTTTLVNEGTITGDGNIGGTSLVLVNSGVIDASTSSELQIRSGASGVPGSMVIVNSGVLETTKTHLDLVKVTISGGGTIAASGVAARAVLDNATVQGGVLTTSGGGEILTADAVLLDGMARTVKIQGRLDVRLGSILSLRGGIHNTGSVSSEGEVLVGVNTALSGGGQITLAGVTVAAGPNGLSGAAPSLINIDNTISGAGSIGGVNGKGANLTLVNKAAGVIASSGGTLNIDTGANTITNAGLIEALSGSTADIKSAVVNTGVLAAAGGTLIIEASVSGGGSVRISAGTADVTTPYAGAVAFTGATGVLELANSQAYTGTVSGFSTTGGTSLDLADIAFVAPNQATFVGTSTGGVLTVTDGTHVAKINLTGNYLGSTFTASSDGHGGTDVVDPAKAAASPAAAPVMPFIAAAAAMGGGAGGSSAAHLSAGSAHSLALLAPHAQSA